MVFSQSEIHQLMKFPELVKHYFEHKESAQNLSFLDFLNLHYSSDSKNTDQHDHHQLPFKSHECQHAQILIVDAIPTYEMPAVYAPEREFYCKEKNFVFSEVLGSIWQPPQV
jgi:hypothetical protein